MDITENSIDRFVHGGMVVLPEDAPVHQAARAMHERRVGSVIVCDHSGHIVGLLTDRDLTSQVIAFGHPTNTPIREFMTTDISKLPESATVKDAIQMMEDFGIRRIPIVRRSESGREKCVGMITLDDLIAEKVIAPESLSRIVSQQILKVHKRRESHRNDEKHEQALNRFYSIVSRHTGLDRGTSEDVSFHVLSAIVQRLPPSGAVQMISQLPKLLQENLLDLRAGPNRSIDANGILASTAERFQLTPTRAGEIIERFWHAFEEFTGTTPERDQVLRQLPRPMRWLLGETHATPSRDSVA